MSVPSILAPTSAGSLRRWLGQNWAILACVGLVLLWALDDADPDTYSEPDRAVVKNRAPAGQADAPRALAVDGHRDTRR